MHAHLKYETDAQTCKHYDKRSAVAAVKQANSLEWLTPTVPPEHGNFGDKLPVVHRWPYDFSVPGATEDFIPQTTPPSEVTQTESKGSNFSNQNYSL